MQESHITLKEIVWEITGRCNNNCAYCGSKDIVKKEKESEEGESERIIKIAQEIAKCPPSEIDISGGDPLLVPFETHKQMVEILKKAGVYCKIVCNPLSLQDSIQDKSNSEIDAVAEGKRNILSLYDWIGFSISTQKELKIFKEFINKYKSYQNYTIITNFNVLNLYDYDTFENFVKEINKTWMVQFTVYKESGEQLAIYNNDSAFGFLRDKVLQSIKGGTKIVISDNATNFPCGAGKVSIGITYDGNVVPCLSMRSWTDVKKEYQGNILKTSLLKIWEDGFKKYRFSYFKCCKDVCKMKNLLQDVSVSTTPFLEIDKDASGDDVKKQIEEWLKKQKETKQNPYQNPIDPTDYPRATYYGVTPGNVYVYGVIGGAVTIMYAVYPSAGTGANIQLLYGVTRTTTNYTTFNPDLTIKNEEEKKETPEDDLPF